MISSSVGAQSEWEVMPTTHQIDQLSHLLLILMPLYPQLTDCLVPAPYSTSTEMSLFGWQLVEEQVENNIHYALVDFWSQIQYPLGGTCTILTQLLTQNTIVVSFELIH